MSSFHDVLFPLRLARGAVGGPQRRTDVISLANGREVRVAAFAGSRRRWEVSSSMLGLDGLAEITAFFEARRGRLHSFRFRDPADHQAPMGQRLGLGDGVKRDFQLVCHYGDGTGSYARTIALPWDGNITVAQNGVTIPAGDYQVTLIGGVVTFDTAPPVGAIITAGFGFDCVARFDSDSLDIALDAFNAGRTLSIPLIEVAL